jgi:hypothetical protein
VCQHLSSSSSRSHSLQQHLSALVFTLLWTVAVLSASSAHKEFRFLLPLLPLVAPIAAAGLLVAGRWVGGVARLAAVVLLIHVPVAWYLSRWHQHGACLLSKRRCRPCPSDCRGSLVVVVVVVEIVVVVVVVMVPVLTCHAL